MNKNLFIVESLFVILSTSIFIAFFLKGKNKKNKNNGKIYKLIQSLYEKLTKVPVIGKEIVDIKKRLYINKYNNEETSRIMAVIYYLASWLASIVLFLLLYIVYKESTYIVCVIAFVCYYLKIVLTDYLIGDDTKLLEQVVEFVKDLKHQFNLTGSVEQALYESSKLSGDLMKTHSKNMHECILSKESLNDYIAPNKYLKLIYNIIYLTSEYGDKKVDGKSIFIKNMNYIMREIKMELDKRDKIKYWLKALTTVALLPVLFPSMIKNWVLPKFPQSIFFYESSLDIITKIFILIISLGCFFGLRELEKNIDKQFKLKSDKKQWESVALDIKVINKVVMLFVPKENSKQYYKDKKLIQESGSNLTIEWLYLRKIICSVIAFVLVMSSIIGLQRLNINNTINNTSYKFIKYDTIVNVGKEQVSVTEFDKDIFENILKKDKKSNEVRKIEKEEIIKEIKLKGIKDEEVIKANALRIEEKLNYMNNQHFKWYHLIIALVIALFSSDIPNLKLFFQRRLRKADMDSEIFEFYTIILLLMYNDRASIEMIIEWMERFSEVFKEPLQKCRNNLGQGVFESLQVLKDECKYKPFGKIVDNLIMSEKIKIKDAFESLESEREFFEKEKEELNARIVAERKELGDLLGVIPTLSLFVFYLTIPLLWACTIQFNSIYNQLA